jgi:hypothetical protein
MKRLLVLLACVVCPLFAQTNTGELRLKVTDPKGLASRVTVKLQSKANDYESEFATSDTGETVAKRLRYGVYELRIDQQGFAPVLDTVEIRSSLPTERTIQLSLSPVNSSVLVKSTDTLIDPDRAGAVNQIGSDTIQYRTGSLPGRSIQDLVNTQPGWLYEGNAVLHPRGSEYQTQFVIDGIPLTDNRSPSFGPEIGADDVDSLTIYTAGFPAEYGRKMGGVIEVNTFKDTQEGVHGQVILSGGSFDNAGIFAQVQYGWGNNALGVSATGSSTSHYLNPVVPENFTNTGTIGDYAVRYERDFTPQDRLTLSVRHEFSRYEIPNEQLQQTPHDNFFDPTAPLDSQLQNAGNAETMGIIGYQHIFSSNVVADFRGMVRDNSNYLQSNPYATPIYANQQNWFREGYFTGNVAIHHGRHEIKIGVDSDNYFLHENFSDIITDPTQFDPDTPATFSFAGTRPNLEQSAYLQDLIHLGNWTINAGLRWDHYQLLLNQNAVSPRITAARFFPSTSIVLHASYDRIFQTPSFENILLSSSPTVVSLSDQVLRLPVQPSHGDYFEAGLSKAFFGQLRLDTTIYRRQVNNYADDDQLLNTAVSFPIAFRKSVIYGAEGKIELPDWHGLSGFASYSWMVGNAWFPVTGGLFLGDDAQDAISQLSGHFPDSQDQRNTVRTRFRYQILPRLWLAAGVEYGSGLPFEFTGTEEEALAQYGQEVVDRVNFDRGRVRPSLSVDASIGADLYKSERLKMRIQADVRNLNDRLNVIDFGGLFSGNAIGPPRSYFLRLTTSF